MLTHLQTLGWQWPTRVGGPLWVGSTGTGPWFHNDLAFGSYRLISGFNAVNGCLICWASLHSQHHEPYLCVISILSNCTVTPAGQYKPTLFYYTIFVSWFLEVVSYWRNKIILCQVILQRFLKKWAIFLFHRSRIIFYRCQSYTKLIFRFPVLMCVLFSSSNIIFFTQWNPNSLPHSKSI